MTDEEIRTKSAQFGKEVRDLEDQGLELERTKKRLEWSEFRNQLTGTQLSLAVESYYDTYFQR